ncbi:hypothetical protein TNCV_5053591 [Trichonephila clavipes]|nr:hypothetical protein TNCV_5053591 [Trichonephila clavipes]
MNWVQRPNFFNVLLLLMDFYEFINCQLLTTGIQQFLNVITIYFQLYARQDRHCLQSHYPFHQFFSQIKDELTISENCVTRVRISRGSISSCIIVIFGERKLCDACIVLVGYDRANEEN